MNTTNLIEAQKINSGQSLIKIEKSYYPDGKIWTIETKLNNLRHGMQYIYSRDNSEIYFCIEYDMGKPLLRSSQK